jgi:hypothetical protein
VNRGLTASAAATIAEALSGTRTLNTPPKNPQAASHPAMNAASVWVNDSHTNMCREQHAVKISACTFRCRPDTGSASKPR